MLIDALQSDLDQLSSWCTNWNLQLSPYKSACIQFSLSTITILNSLHSITREIIPTVMVHRDLGIIVISHNLQWNHHNKSHMLICVSFPILCEKVHTTSYISTTTQILVHMHVLSQIKIINIDIYTVPNFGGHTLSQIFQPLNQHSAE